MCIRLTFLSYSDTSDMVLMLAINDCFSYDYPGRIERLHSYIYLLFIINHYLSLYILLIYLHKTHLLCRINIFLFLLCENISVGSGVGVPLGNGLRRWYVEEDNIRDQRNRDALWTTWATRALHTPILLWVTFWPYAFRPKLCYAETLTITYIRTGVRCTSQNIASVNRLVKSMLKIFSSIDRNLYTLCNCYLWLL